jgi:hypothetical protein
LVLCACLFECLLACFLGVDDGDCERGAPLFLSLLTTAPPEAAAAAVPLARPPVDEDEEDDEDGEDDDEVDDDDVDDEVADDDECDCVTLASAAAAAEAARVGEKALVSANSEPVDDEPMNTPARCHKSKHTTRLPGTRYD